MKLRIGILSTASIVPRLIGAVRAAETLLSTDCFRGCTISAIASRDLEKARQKARLWNVPEAYGSYEDLINSPKIDIVYIATINSEHYRYAKLALEAGKHVLCEKPFTLDAAQARELFVLAREKGLFLMEMQKTVFLPVIRQIRELIQSGSFGRIIMADFSSSYAPDYNGWFFDAAKGGGPLYGNAGYSLQLMQYLLNCYAAEWTGLCTRSSTGVEDQFSSLSAWKTIPSIRIKPVCAQRPFIQDIFTGKKDILSFRTTGKRERPFFIIKKRQSLSFLRNPANTS